jgi:dihydroxyacetone kinase-like protein
MAFVQCAQAITKVSGSSFGTLMAIAMMAVGKAVKGKTDLEWSETSHLVETAMNAMITRGGANLGDKTVLDGLNAIQEATKDGDQPNELVEAATIAVIETLDKFRNQPCRIGRARVYGDKSVGMDDPGMVAIARMVDSIRQEATPQNGYLPNS